MQSVLPASRYRFSPSRNKEKFLEGLKRYLEAGNTDCICRREGRNDPRAGEFEIDPGMIDANEADSIIQYALFGELVYA